MRIKVNPHPGLFIDIEGLDGSGATTQIKLLKESLKKKGITVYLTKEPTDNLIGGLIRAALTGTVKLPPEALQLLFVADRSHHLAREIIPILKRRSILVSDRFLWSTIAFGAVDLSQEWLLQLHRYCFLPDLTIFLMVSPRKCIKRIKGDRFSLELFEQERKMGKVWRNYECLARKFPRTVKIIDGEGSKTKIAKVVLDLVGQHSKFRKLKKSVGIKWA